MLVVPCHQQLPIDCVQLLCQGHHRVAQSLEMNKALSLLVATFCSYASVSYSYNLPGVTVSSFKAGDKVVLQKYS